MSDCGHGHPLCPHGKCRSKCYRCLYLGMMSADYAGRRRCEMRIAGLRVDRPAGRGPYCLLSLYTDAAPGVIDAMRARP